MFEQLFTVKLVEKKRVYGMEPFQSSTDNSLM